MTAETTPDPCTVCHTRPNRPCYGVDRRPLPTVHLDRLPLDATPIYRDVLAGVA